jgi:hypothetical protein
MGRVLLFGFGFVAAGSAVTFYIVEMIRLSRFFGGFERMEVARPAGYPGILGAILIPAPAAGLAVYCAWRFIRACQRVRKWGKSKPGG